MRIKDPAVSVVVLSLNAKSALCQSVHQLLSKDSQSITVAYILCLHARLPVDAERHSTPPASKPAFLHMTASDQVNGLFYVSRPATSTAAQRNIYTIGRILHQSTSNIYACVS